ncbi:hypothetical protein C3486_17205 [Streptomyces sp. Ru73]|uniref:hypothetical protein n=1 Tax=Streptomyces sp. Ru73 TaxID=2080748 RepID=UPI000CDDB298|nr:hypothetical protein [Streptomyces sp. Ru73]POX39630.1 hypothetical protein C3486_17205 [Streptomyces sp. Ru73]
MKTATATHRFRGRSGRRIVAAVVAAAALGLGATACGQDSGSAGAASSSGSSSASGSQQGSASSDQAGAGSSAGKADKGAQGQNGGQAQHTGKSEPAPSTGADSKSAADGGGVANAGNHRTVVGKLEYLAPGKLIVDPEDGGMDQAFFVANATKILGAAAICSDDSGSVSIGDDGYGTAECTVEQLEKAAKTKAVTVRVTMSTKSGAAETVEEKYHP